MHETTNRCNGHIQVSSPACKGSKRDRKGCKKGKIEAIMKNNMGSTKPKTHLDLLFKKKSSNVLNTFSRHSNSTGVNMLMNNIGITPGSVIKHEIIDDPYTFTDNEPGVGLYLTSNNIKKEHCSMAYDTSYDRNLETAEAINSIISVKSDSVSGNRKINNSCGDSLIMNGDAFKLSPRLGEMKTNESTNNIHINTSCNTGNNLSSSNSCRTNSSNYSFFNATCNSGNSLLNKAVTADIPLKSSSVCSNSLSKHKRISNNVGVSNRRSSSDSGVASPVNKNLKSVSNKAETDFARSRSKKPSTLVYRSNAEDSPGSVGKSQFFHPKTLLPLQRTFAKVSIPVKKMHRQTTWQRERRIRHEVLQRIRDTQMEATDNKRDLFPLGVDVTDSEDDDVISIAGTDAETEDIYQRHWFTYTATDCFNKNFSLKCRQTRLNMLRNELRRQLRQMWRGIERTEIPSPSLVKAIVNAARTQPIATAMLINPHRTFMTLNNQKINRAKVSMLDPKQCSICDRKALPCTRHCTRHIMYNVDQQLFNHCSWKSEDKIQCRMPVFDIIHQSPLCPQHAKKEGYNRLKTDVFVKKARKKPKSSSLSRSRSKKKKKKQSSNGANSSSSIISDDRNVNRDFLNSVCSNSNLNNSNIRAEDNDGIIIDGAVIDDAVIGGDLIIDPNSAACRLVPPDSSGTSNNFMHSMVTGSTSDVSGNNVFVAGVEDSLSRRQNNLLTPSALTTVTSSSSSCIPISQVEIQVQLEDVEEVPEEVLAIASLDPTELASQATRLLEDQDLTNMLNIPADAFNDLFTEDKNGQYEPTREETEELERALEAVDKDVRSLERMTRALPLTLPIETMNTLLDDPAVASALPSVYAGVGYPNGFASSVQTDLRHS